MSWNPYWARVICIKCKINDVTWHPTAARAEAWALEQHGLHKHCVASENQIKHYTASLPPEQREALRGEEQ